MGVKRRIQKHLCLVNVSVVIHPCTDKTKSRFNTERPSDVKPSSIAGFIIHSGFPATHNVVTMAILKHRLLFRVLLITPLILLTPAAEDCSFNTELS